MRFRPTIRRGRSRSFIAAWRNRLCLGLEERPKHIGLFGMHSLKLCFVVFSFLELGISSTGCQLESDYSRSDSRLLLCLFHFSGFGLFSLQSSSFFLQISPAPFRLRTSSGVNLDFLVGEALLLESLVAAVPSRLALGIETLGDCYVVRSRLHTFIQLLTSTRPRSTIFVSWVLRSFLSSFSPLTKSYASISSISFKILTHSSRTRERSAFRALTASRCSDGKCFSGSTASQRLI
jgi:hypothetical protein